MGNMKVDAKARLSTQGLIDFDEPQQGHSGAMYMLQCLEVEKMLIVKY